MVVPNILQSFLFTKKIVTRRVLNVLTKEIKMSVSSARSRARRLALMIDESGSDADPSCGNCLRARRRCVIAPFSRRCLECVVRSTSCPLLSTHSQAAPSSASYLEREVALRFEIAQLLARLRVCLAELDTLDRSSSGGPRTRELSQGN